MKHIQGNDDEKEGGHDHDLREILKVLYDIKNKLSFMANELSWISVATVLILLIFIVVV